MGAPYRSRRAWQRARLDRALPLRVCVGGSGPYFSENVPKSSTATEAQFATQHHCDFWDQILVY
jgi:hypothetical protein